MEGNYDITLDGVVVGSAHVERCGLYYCFSCRCRIPNGERIHLKVKCGNSINDLGLCVPLDNEFGVNTKLAMKKIGEGSPEFYLGEQKTIIEDDEMEIRNTERPKIAEQQETKILFDAEKPFEQLQELDNAILKQEDGGKVILIQSQDQVQPDNDQNP